MALKQTRAREAFNAFYQLRMRLSFNSFIPNELDNDLAGRLVDYYVDHLVKEPALHDKVEFEIVLSCYTFDIKRRLRRLRKVGFSDKDCKSLSNSLRKLTNNIIHPKHGLWKTDADKLDVLISRRQKILQLLRRRSGSELQKTSWQCGWTALTARPILLMDRPGQRSRS